MIEYKDTSWWFWLVTVCLLTAGVAGYPTGFLLAIGLTVIQLVYFAIREGGISAFPVQVRLGYLLYLLVVYPEPLRPLYWIPVIGTWAQIIFGYCTMARLVTLMPWNRQEPVSLRTILATFLARPVRGNIMQGLPRTDAEGEAERIAAEADKVAAETEGTAAPDEATWADALQDDPRLHRFPYAGHSNTLH